MSTQWNNIVDEYTNEITANKSTIITEISHIHTSYSIFFGKLFFISVRCKSAHIPLDVCPRY